jgi:hypothetical protein
VQAFGVEHGILTQTSAPIGGITFYRDSGHRSTLEGTPASVAAPNRTPSPCRTSAAVDGGKRPRVAYVIDGRTGSG